MNISDISSFFNILRYNILRNSFLFLSFFYLFFLFFIGNITETTKAAKSLGIHITELQKHAFNLTRIFYIRYEIQIICDVRFSRQSPIV